MSMSSNNAAVAAPKNHRRVSVGGAAASIVVGSKKDSTARKMEAMGAQREARRRAMQEQKHQRQVENERNIAAGNPGDVDFIGLVRSWRIDNSHTARPLAYVGGGGAALGGALPPLPPRICVAVRKRPISDKERERCDHDSVTVLHPKVWVHAAKLKVDGIRKYLDHSSYEFDYAFDENADTLDVYKLTTLPLLQFVVSDAGRRATVFCYGQTGSGKTHTMQGIQNLLAEDLFALLMDNGTVTVSLSMYELYGGFLQDLLNDRKRLKVLEDGKGEINVTGLTEREASSVEMFHTILQQGNAERTTHATQANDSSSRSHAICTILLRSSVPTVPERRRGGPSQPATPNLFLGKLSLVDLAGSERGNDTTSHNAQRRSESADINTSLLALKECIRAMGSCDNNGDPATAGNNKRPPHIPYRQSKLTLILKDCLASADARTAMIATVSPGASAADHSVNTLRYADRVKDRGGGPSHPSTRQPRSKSPPHPRSANNAAVVVGQSPANLIRPVDRLYASNLGRAPPPSQLSSRPTTIEGAGGDRLASTRSQSSPTSPSDSSPLEALASKPSSGDDSLLLIDSVGTGDSDDFERRAIERSRVDRSSRSPRRAGNDPVAPDSEPKTDLVETRVRASDALLEDGNHAASNRSDDQADFEDGDDDKDDYQWLKREEEDVLNLHMGYIHENADLLSREGEMLLAVQSDRVEPEDIQEYAVTLARMLDRKEDMIMSMQNRFDQFQTELLNRRSLVEGSQPRDDEEAA